MKKLIVIIGLFVAFSSFAQQKDYSTHSKKAIAFFEESENYYIRRQYGPAVELLQKALDKDENFAEAHLRMMRIYSTVEDKAKVQYHARQVTFQETDNPKFAEAYYTLAAIAFDDGDYELAEKHITKLLALDVNQRIRAEGERMHANISFARTAIEHPIPINPKSLPSVVNKLPLQYFPVLTADQQSIIFTGRRGITPQYDEDLYISTKDNKGEWQSPKLISPNITSEFNEGTCSISADGRTLIFTSCLGRRVLGSCDLFISYKEGDEWSVPENMGNRVNSSAWESQPSLSADGKTLYFVSDRPGGRGMRDLYVSIRAEDGQWDKPKNLGPEINTPMDDVSPFIHVNGQTLYFASTGYPGFGGFDLYQAEKKGDKWTEPKNLGYPLNTHGDQVSLYMTADGSKGYYSLEKGRENIDYTSIIMEFDVPEAIRVKNRSNFVKGIIRDAETKEVLSAKVELFDLDAQKREYTVQSDAVTGEYMMVLTEGSEYALYVDKNDYLFESLTFNYNEDGNSQKLEPIYIDIYLQPIKAGKETILNNIFFDTDQFVLKPKSKTELQKVIRFLQQNPDISIRINGHTDDVGTSSYNQQLSLNRAKAVYEYLAESGISSDRLDYKGFGETKPLTANDSEANRQKNRRIAFEVIL